MIPALTALVELLRTRTRRLLELPEGEAVVVEEVHDEPWWAFNYYQGDLRSRVVVNADTLTTPFDLVGLAAHEAYPGHHTEHAVKEQLLIRDRGCLEEAIQLVPTPQVVVSEGIAEIGLDLLLDEELEREIGDVLAAHGLEDDLGLALAVDRARRPIRGLGARCGADHPRARRHGRGGAGPRRALGAANARAGRADGAVRDRPHLAGLRRHLLGRAGALRRLRRRRPRRGSARC